MEDTSTKKQSSLCSDKRSRLDETKRGAEHHTSAKKQPSTGHYKTNAGGRNKNIGVRTIKFCGMEYKSDTTVVDCRDKTVTDLTPLMGLKRLKHLSLSETQVNDLTSLKGLKELENLWLSGTQVKEITPLKGLMKLKNLDLAKTKVIDLTPLKGLKKLKYLYLKKTEVTESQVNELKEALPNCSVAIP